MTNLINGYISNEEISGKFNQFVSKLRSIGCEVLVDRTFINVLVIRFAKDIRFDEVTCNEVAIEVDNGNVDLVRVDMVEGENQIKFEHEVRENRLDNLYTILDRIIVWLT